MMLDLPDVVIGVSSGKLCASDAHTGRTCSGAFLCNLPPMDAQIERRSSC